MRELKQSTRSCGVYWPNPSQILSAVVLIGETRKIFKLLFFKRSKQNHILTEQKSSYSNHRLTSSSGSRSSSFSNSPATVSRYSIGSAANSTATRFARVSQNSSSV